MECPRCNGPVESFTLGEATAVVCETCGYVGIPTDHRVVSGSSESWEEALERFRDRQDAESE